MPAGPTRPRTPRGHRPVLGQQNAENRAGRKCSMLQSGQHARPIALPPARSAIPLRAPLPERASPVSCSRVSESLIGTVAAACAELALAFGAESRPEYLRAWGRARTRRRPTHRRSATMIIEPGGVPAREDEIPPAMCTRCGFTGPHASPRECIEALRDRVAILEFKLSARR